MRLSFLPYTLIFAFYGVCLGILDYPEDIVAFVAENKGHSREVAYLHCGMSEEEKGNYSKALYLYNRSVSSGTDEQMHVFLAYRGCLYEKINCCEKAKSDYDRAIKLKPECSGLYCLRGDLLSKLGKCDASERDLVKAVTIANNIDKSFSEHVKRKHPEIDWNQFSL